MIGFDNWFMGGRLFGPVEGGSQTQKGSWKLYIMWLSKTSWMFVPKYDQNEKLVMFFASLPWRPDAHRAG